ncbi:MAG: hypothetical protein QOH97_710 [Actinoplanes sp.]|jgi:hypothetical protein|nr:hypothetical protein [Actinoplanes sp.]
MAYQATTLATLAGYLGARDDEKVKGKQVWEYRWDPADRQPAWSARSHGVVD